VQNLEKKERKLHQTRSNFRTGNSDLDGKYFICRNTSAIAFRLGGRITTGTKYLPQNVYRNGVPVRSGTTTPLFMTKFQKQKLFNDVISKAISAFAQNNDSHLLAMVGRIDTCHTRKINYLVF